MNALSYALGNIHHEIEKYILELAFKENQQYTSQIINIDTRILNTIIRPRVLIDCNIVGGISMSIPMNRCQIISTGDPTSVLINVPKELTSGRTIMSVSVINGQTMNLSNTYGVSNGSGMMGVLNKGMMRSNPSDILTLVTNLEVVGEGLILANDCNYLSIQNGTMEVTVSNAVDMSNIKVPNYIEFSELCLKAVKAYIFKTLRLKSAKGTIYQGQELPIVMEIINEYSSKNEEYKEYRDNTWSQVAFINDKKAYSSFLSDMIS